MFNNVSIKSRLMFVISLLSVLLIGVGGLGIYGLNQTNDSFKGVYEDRAVPLGDLALIVDRMQRIRLNTALASYSRNAEIVKQRKELTSQRDAEITATWQKYLATNLTSIEKTLIESFNQGWREFVEARERTMSSALAGHYDAAITNYDGEVSRKYDAAHATLFKLLELQRDEGTKEFGIAQNNYENIFITSVTVITLGILLAAVIGFLLIRAIIGPLNEAVAVANAVASGDLTSRIEVNSNDEIGRLLHALKTMNDNLADLVGKVRIGTDQITTASSEIASGNSDLSQRTEEQASSLEETASSMEELTS
ncbi:methyl-accepting chemotaxis protein, partial [Nitrosomonas sp. Nm166]|uniref:methyl-accepting chemotaxis protein n=1 Tax=Nitrosomonas sp. Nm166 TaxID=1881054 RepID=UPI0008DFF1AE